MTDTPIPKPKVGFFEYFEEHFPFKAKMIFFLVVVATVVVGIYYIYDMHRQLQEEKVKSATLAQGFQQLGTSAVSKNEFESNKDATNQIIQAQGKAVGDFAKQTNSTLQSVTSAMGTIQSSVSNIQGKLSATDFASHQNQTTGALTNYPLEESRVSSDGKTLPPLSQVRLSFDPTQRDPNVAFKGTTWVHYREDFKQTVGEWQSKKDGGYKATVSLQRSIYKPDPANPGQWISVGTEDIQQADATTTFTAAGLKQPAVTMTKWLVLAGVGKSNGASPLAQGSYQPYLGLFRHIAGPFGGFVAVQNNSVAVGVGIGFGH